MRLVGNSDYGKPDQPFNQSAALLQQPSQLFNDQNVVHAFLDDAAVAVGDGLGGAVRAAASAGDTLDGKIQDSPDGSTGWADLTGKTFAQVTEAAAAFESILVDKDQTRGWIRYVGTIAGVSPSITFGVIGMGFNKTR